MGSDHHPWAPVPSLEDLDPAALLGDPPMRVTLAVDEPNLAVDRTCLTLTTEDGRVKLVATLDSALLDHLGDRAARALCECAVALLAEER